MIFKTHLKQRRCAIASIRNKRTYTLLDSLDQLKTSFGSKPARDKTAIVKVLAKRDITDVNELERYHDILCFLRAYPDNAGFLKLVEHELGNFRNRIETYKLDSGDMEAEYLADTGIVGSGLSHTFSFELTVSLSEWFGNRVEIDWEQYYESENDTISAFLPLIVSYQENDTLDNDLETATREWLNIAGSAKDKTELAILLKMIRTSGLPRAVQRHLFENAEIAIRWNLTDCPASRTLKRIPFGKRFYQSRPMIGRTPDLRARLKQSAPKLSKLSYAEGSKYVRHIREVLGVRCRELYPLIHSDHREVYTYEPGRGLQLVVLGDIVDIRLPLESNFGAMLIRNGMPVGYGIGCMLFDRVEIAINIFPAYRTGESSFIIEEFFRLFYAHFGARVLLVRAYQVGDENNMEALESGSFWFYYKLGFRPVKKSVRELAAKEYEKIKSRKGYRTPLATLKRLAKSDIFFHIDPGKMDSFEELSLIDLGYTVTKYIASKHDGDRKQATDRSAARTIKRLGIRDIKSWTDDELTSLRRLSPLMDCIKGIDSWSAKEKTDLAKIIRAKGSASQRRYTLLCNRHGRFRGVLENL